MSRKNSKSREASFLRRYEQAKDRPLDTTPVEMPVGYSTPTPLQDMIANMIRKAVELEKPDDALETFEEAEDFEEVDPDIMDMSPYELTQAHSEFDMGYEVENQGDPRPNDQGEQPDTGDTPDQNESEPD